MSVCVSVCVILSACHSLGKAAEAEGSLSQGTPVGSGLQGAPLSSKREGRCRISVCRPAGQGC